MTKEELKQEAEEYANNLVFVFETDIVQRIVRERVRLALIDVLEPREKRIAYFEKELKDKDSQLNNWYKEWQKQEKRIAELEAQIEKMKNCRNCKNEKIEGACGHFTQVGWCKNWELAK